MAWEGVFDLALNTFDFWFRVGVTAGVLLLGVSPDSRKCLEFLPGPIWVYGKYVRRSDLSLILDAPSNGRSSFRASFQADKVTITPCSLKKRVKEE